MAGVCAACETDFKPKQHGYHRFSKTKKVNGETIASMLDSYGILKDDSYERAFVCSKCYSHLKTIKVHESLLQGRKGNQRKLDPTLLDQTTDTEGSHKPGSHNQGSLRRMRVLHLGKHEKQKQCVTCSKDFILRNKKYDRFGVSRYFGDQSIVDILNLKFSIKVDRGSFLCSQCYSALEKYLNSEAEIKQTIGIPSAEDAQFANDKRKGVRNLHFLESVAFYDALQYLEDVILKYWDKHEVVIKLLEILSKWRIRMIDHKAVKANVKELFDSAEDMLLGFNVFLPETMHYDPDVEKEAENPTKESETAENPIEPRGESETVQLDKGIGNSALLETGIVEKEKESVKGKKQQTTSVMKKTLKFGPKLLDIVEMNSSEAKQPDDVIEILGPEQLTDLVKIENIDDETEQVSQTEQDMAYDRKGCGENVSFQSWTLQDDFGSAITVSENKDDDSETESETETKSPVKQKEPVKLNTTVVLTENRSNSTQNTGLKSDMYVLKKPNRALTVDSQSKCYTVSKTLPSNSQKQCLLTNSLVKPNVMSGSSLIVNDVSQSVSVAPKVGLQHVATSLETLTVTTAYSLVKSKETTSLVKPKVTVIDVLTKYNTPPVLQSSSPNMNLQSPTTSLVKPNMDLQSVPTSLVKANVGFQGENLAESWKSIHVVSSDGEDCEYIVCKLSVCLKKSRGSDLGFILAKGSDYHSFHVQKIYGPPATKSVLRTGDKIYKINEVFIGHTDLSIVKLLILNLDGVVTLEVHRLEKMRREKKSTKVIAQVPPVLVPPSSLPETQVPPVLVPPSSLPVTQVPPVLVPPSSLPVTQVPPVLVPPSSFPVTPVSATMPTLIGMPALATLPVSLPVIGPVLYPIFATPQLVPMSLSLSTPSQLIPMSFISTMSSSGLIPSAGVSAPQGSSVSSIQSPITSLDTSKLTPLSMQSISTPLPMHSTTGSLLTRPASTPVMTHSITPASVASDIQPQAVRMAMLPQGMKLPSNIPDSVSKLGKSKGLKRAVSPAVKPSKELSDKSKKQLLDSLSRTIVDNEAILTDTIGIKLRQWKHSKQIEQNADEHEQSVTETSSSTPPSRNFKKKLASLPSVTSSNDLMLSKLTEILGSYKLLSPKQILESLTVSDSKNETSKLTSTQGSSKVLSTKQNLDSGSKVTESQASSKVPSTGISKKQFLESLSNTITENECILNEDLAIKLCKVGKSKTVAQKGWELGVSQAEVVHSSSVGQEPKLLLHSKQSLPNMTTLVYQGKPLFSTAESERSDIVSVYSMGNDKIVPEATVLVKEIPNAESKGTPFIVNSVTLQNSIPSALKSDSLELEQSVTKDSQESDKTQFSSAMKKKGTFGTSEAKLSNTKSDPSENGKDERQLIDTLKQINSSASTEDTKVKLLKAALELVTKTKQSNPEIQNFKLSVVKTADLDKRIIQDLSEASAGSAVELMATDSSDKQKEQDDDARRSANCRIDGDDHMYFQDVKNKKKRLAMVKHQKKKKQFEKIETIKKIAKKRSVKVQTAKVTRSENEVKDAETKIVHKISKTPPGEDTNIAEESDTEFSSVHVQTHLMKPDNIIDLDHAYTGITSWRTQTTSSQSDLALVKPKEEKMDTDNAETSGVVATLGQVNEDPMPSAPSPDFLQAIQVAKLGSSNKSQLESSHPNHKAYIRKTQVGGTYNVSDIPSYMKTSFVKLSKGEVPPGVSPEKSVVISGSKVPGASKSIRKLSSRGRAIKHRVIEDISVIPRKRQKLNTPKPRPFKKPVFTTPKPRPFKKPVFTVKPENFCVHCYKSFTLNTRTTKISLTEYLRIDNGGRQVLLGTFLKCEVGVTYVSPKWCLCHVCFNICERIQRWRELFVGAKQTLELAESEFQKRKNDKALLYTNGGRIRELTVVSEGMDRKQLEEIVKQKAIASVSSKIEQQFLMGDSQGPGRPTIKEKLVSCLHRSQYQTLFSTLYKHSKSGRRALLEVVKKFVRKEIREHIKRKDSVMICEGLEDIERFNWVSLMREFSALPFTSGILMAMLTKSDKPIQEGKFPTEDTQNVQREYGRAFGVLVSILFYFRNYRFNTFQIINSIHMYDKNCLKQLFHIFWNVGFCFSNKQQIIQRLKKWSNELGVTAPLEQLNNEVAEPSNTAEEEMEVPYTCDPDENQDVNNENDDDAQLGGQSQKSGQSQLSGQLQLSRQSENLTSEEAISNEELDQALSAIGSFERMTEREITETQDEAMQESSHLKYVTEETGHVPVFEHFGVEVVEGARTESLVMEVDKIETDTSQDTAEDDDGELKVQIKSVRDDGTIEIGFEGEEDTELHTLDEWMKIFASKS